MLITNKLIRTRENLVSLILDLFTDSNHHDRYKSLSRKFFQKLTEIWATRGKTFTIMYLKKSRLCVTRFISGEPISFLDGVATKSGWPLWLTAQKQLIESAEGIKVLLTLLTVLRDLHLPAKLETGPITENSNYVYPNVSRAEHIRICKELGISKKKVEWSRYHMSTKKGPNGQAIWTSLYDLDALPSKLIDDIRSMAGSPLGRHIDAILKPNSLQDHSLLDIWKALWPNPKSESFIRKLSYFSDKEGKSRVIAILDYWSQTALYPLHTVVNRMLKKIKTDCTFDQNGFKSLMDNCKDCTYHSIDLSNATDRMPIAFQKKVVASIIGRDRSESWARILTDYPFTCREFPNGIKYQVGQPMGAYSSWPVMALTHHYIVKLAALRVGKQSFWNYALLGDDIVIADTDVAQSYKGLLQTLDMPISLPKTHTSEIVYEFAKRWVYKGMEVTPYSIGGLIKSYGKYPYFYNFSETQATHGWILPKDRHPELVHGVYRIMGKARHGLSTYKLYALFRELTDMKNTRTFNSNAIEVLEQCFGIPSIRPEERIPLTEKLVKQVRVDLLNMDMEKWNLGLYHGLMAINNAFASMFPGLDAPAFRQLNRSNIPLIMAINYKVDDSEETLCMIFDPETPIEKLLEIEGLGKYSVSREFFNLRDSRAILLAFSRLVKGFITAVKEAINTDPGLLETKQSPRPTKDIRGG